MFTLTSDGLAKITGAVRNYTLGKITKDIDKAARAKPMDQFVQCLVDDAVQEALVLGLEAVDDEGMIPATDDRPAIPFASFVIVRAKRLCMMWELTGGQRDGRANSGARNLDHGFRVDSEGFLHRMRPRAGTVQRLHEDWDGVSRMEGPLETLGHDEAMEVILECLTDEQRHTIAVMNGEADYAADEASSRMTIWRREDEVKSVVADLISALDGER